MNTCETCLYYMVSLLQEPCKSCRLDGVTLSNWRGYTNADRIREMSGGELATLISSDFCEVICSPETNCQYTDCRGKILNWLRQEVKESE